MSSIATVKIKTGPDSYITVNEADYEAFKFMEYTEPVQMPLSMPSTQEEPTRKKRSNSEEV